MTSFMEFLKCVFFLFQDGPGGMDNKPLVVTSLNNLYINRNTKLIFHFATTESDIG